MASRTIVKNRICSSGLSLNTPVKVDVRVVDPCLRMPRIAMHICSASIITATPRGLSTSWMTRGDLRGERLLRLQAMGKNVDDAGDLRQTDDLAIRQIADMRACRMIGTMWCSQCEWNWMSRTITRSS